MLLARPIQQVFPTADALLQTPRDKVAAVLIKLAKQQVQWAGVTKEAVCDTGISDGYPGHKKGQVDLHLSKAWNWLEREGFLEPSPDINGKNGWRMLTEEGEALAAGADVEAIKATQDFPRGLLHKAVIDKCEDLFRSAHFPQAVEMSFKVVRDRLRALTGKETGSRAFGEGKLRVDGAIAPWVEGDFNEGVKFLTMAIDMFRNEKVHTSESGIDEPTKALQYLILSSLAMRLLDKAKKP